MGQYGTSISASRGHTHSIHDLVNERADLVDITATIVDFAVRRYLLIRALPKAHDDWELVKLSGPGEDFRTYERTLFRALFSGGDTVRLSELCGSLSEDLATVRRQLYSDMVKQGWYRQSPARTRRVASLLAAGVLGAGGSDQRLPGGLACRRHRRL